MNYVPIPLEAESVLTDRHGCQYTIKGVVGSGGCSILYAAKCGDSEKELVLKECYPAPTNGKYQYTRNASGIVCPVSGDHEAAWAHLRQRQGELAKECRLGQQLSNCAFRALGGWTLIQVQAINGTALSELVPFILMDRLERKGCFLHDILRECEQPPEKGHPLRTGGPPHIYTTARMMEELLKALDNVHRSDYIHGDIQDGNLYFGDTRLDVGDLGLGALLDFGCSRPLPDGKQTAPIADKVIYSTAGFRPPEMLFKNDGKLQLTRATDVYSAGCLLLYLLKQDQWEEIRDKIVLGDWSTQHLSPAEGKQVNCPAAAQTLVNDILERALAYEPGERYPDAAAMLTDLKKLVTQTRPPRYKLPPNLSTCEYFVPGSRAEELSALNEAVESKQPLWIWGLGGIGKTELAIQFGLQQERRAYLIHYERSLQNTIKTLPFSGYPEKDRSEEEKYQEKLYILREDYADSILIVDNFDSETQSLADLQKEEAYRDLIGLPLHVLFTTRYQPDGVTPELAPMRDSDLLNLMHQLYQNPKAEDALLMDIIHTVDCHPLTVYLIAKTLKASHGRVTPEIMLEQMQEGNLNHLSFRKVSTEQNRSYQKARIYEHLKKLFNLSELDECARQVLCHATLLPQGGMEAALFLDCEEGEAEDAFDRLTEHGWLRENEEHLLTIHPLVRQVCQTELKPSEDNCAAFLMNLWDRFEPDEYYNKEQFQQMSDLFAAASNQLEDSEGEYAECAGRIYSELGDYKTALDYELKALSIREAVLPENHPDLAGIHNNVGYTYGALGDHKTELEYLMKALEIREKVLPKNHPDLAISYNNVGGTCGALGDHKTALDYKLKALEIREKVLPEHHSDLAISYNNVGYTYGDLGDHKTALDYQLKALEIWEKVLPEQHPNLATVYNNVGGAYGELGDHKTALEYMLKALEIYEKVLPEDHPDLAGSYNNVGGTYGALGDHKTALEYQLKALAIREAVLPEDHPDLATGYNNVGAAYGALGDHKTELEYQLKALEIREKVLPEHHSDLASSYNNVGYTYGDLGDHKTELEYQLKALEIREAVLPKNHLDLLNSCISVSYEYVQLGDYEAALEYLENVQGNRDADLLREVIALMKKKGE